MIRRARNVTFSENFAYLLHEWPYLIRNINELYGLYMSGAVILNGLKIKLLL